MNLHYLSCFVGGCLSLIPAVSQAKQNKRANDERPNILLILADDMGKECLGTYLRFASEDYR